MIYSLSSQMPKFEHRLSAAGRRAADVRAGQVAAALRDRRLRRGLAVRSWWRELTARGAVAAPTRILWGAR
jgi:hypothetical protein